jgi:hypothetical protein
VFGAALDQHALRSDKQAVNTEAIKKQVVGPGPFIVRTSDGKEYHVPHGELVGFTRHYMAIEDEKGGLDIVDPLHVVAIRPVNKRRARVSV